MAGIDGLLFTMGGGFIDAGDWLVCDNRLAAGDRVGGDWLTYGRSKAALATTEKKSDHAQSKKGRNL